MDEIESKIAAWRETARRALRGEDEAARELEVHLRDHLEAEMAAGVAPAEAFTRAVARLGDIGTIAREFDHLSARWWPGSWAVRGVLALLAGMIGYVALMMAANVVGGTLTPLRALHVVLLVAGYFVLVAIGLIAGTTLLKAWRRGLRWGERRELRAAIFRLSCLNGLLTPIGIGLGMIWAAQNQGAAWTWHKLELGAMTVALSSALLLVVQLPLPLPNRMREFLALFGSLVAVAGFGVFGGLTGAVPAMWLGTSLILAHVAAVILRWPATPPNRAIPTG